ncbi:MAG: tetratricopeptide repeat protein [Chloroflexi bacterium]|nr:tetratricopeptide repeat protein [Chloroflexota bacterium]
MATTRSNTILNWPRVLLMALACISILGVYSQFPASQVVLLAGLVIGGGAWLWHRQAWRVERPFTLTLALWLGSSMLSAAMATMAGHSMTSLNAVALQAAYVGVALLAYLAIRHAGDLQLLMRFLLLLGWLACAIALYFYWGESLYAAIPTMLGAFGNKNHFAGFLLLIQPLALSMLLNPVPPSLPGSRAPEKLIYLVGYAVFTTCLILTFSRGAWLAAIVGNTIVLVLHPAARTKAARPHLIGSVALTLVLVLLLQGNIWSRVQNTTETTVQAVTQPAAEANSVADRWGYYQGALQIWSRSPFWGFGPGSFGSQFQQFEDQPFRFSRYAHNVFLQTLAEQGIAGTLSLVLLLGLVAARGIEALQRRSGTPTFVGDPTFVLVLGLAAGLAASLVHSQVDLDWYLPAIGIIFWLEAGILVHLAAPVAAAPARDILEKIQLGVVLDQLLEAVILVTVAVTPWVLNPWGLDSAILPKATIFRLLAGIVAALWLGRLAAGDSIKLEELIVKMRAEVTQRVSWHAFSSWKSLILHPPFFMLVYLGLATVSTLLSVAPATSFWGAESRHTGLYTLLAIGVVTLIAGRELRRPEQRARVLAAITAGASLTALMALMQYIGLDPVMGATLRGSRVMGASGNAIFLGAYLLMTLPLTLAGVWQRENRLWRSLFMGSALLQLLALVLSQSRGPWLGAAVAGWTMALVLCVARGKRQWALLTAGTILITAGLLVCINTWPGAGQWPLVGRLAVLSSGDGGTTQVRLLIWREVFKLIDQPQQVGDITDGFLRLRPWLGYGLETLRVTFQSVYPPELSHYEAYLAIADQAHNVLLQQTVTVGLLGLAAYLALMLSGALAAWRALRRAQHLPGQLLAAGCLAALAGHLAETQLGIETLEVTLMVWLIIMLACGLIADGALADSVEPSGEKVVAAPFPQLRESRLTLVSRQPAPAKIESKSQWLILALVFLIVWINTSANMNILRADTLAAGASQMRAEYTQRASAGATPLDSARQAQELAPQFPTYAAVLHEQYLGLAATANTPAEQEAYFQQAEEAMVAAIQAAPMQAQFYDVAGEMYLRWALAGNTAKFDKAHAAYQQATTLWPAQAYLWINWAHVYLQQGNTAQALQLVQHAQGLDNRSALAYQELGQVYQASNNLTGAKEAYTQALELNPQLVTPWLGLAETHLISGDPVMAIQAAERYMRLAPRDWNGENLLSVAYYQVGDYPQSLAHAQQAAAMAPAASQAVLQTIVKEVESKIGPGK